MKAIDYEMRLSNFQSRMKAGGIDAAILFHSRDILYYAGTGQPASLVIPAQGCPVIFARRVGPWIRSDCPPYIKVIETGGYGILAKYLAGLNITSGRLGLEEDLLPFSVYQKVMENFKEFESVNISPLILEQRMVKDNDEIQLIKKAALLFSAVHKSILEQARPGLREIDLAAEINSAVRRAGNEPYLFFRTWRMTPFPDGNIASGENTYRVSGQAVTITGVGKSPSMPWGASNRILKKGDLLCIDITLNYMGYHSDQTRTYVLGQANEEQIRLFYAARQVFRRVYDSAQVGMKGSDLYRVAEEEARTLNLLDYFQGCQNDRAPYIGHGLGLEGDEWPGLNAGSNIVLPPNCVFTIEPKFMIPGLGGVQVEDMVWLKAEGKELLSDVPIELFEIY